MSTASIASPVARTGINGHRRLAALCGAGVAALAIAMLVPGVSDACSVCFGDPEARETKAMAAGILVLLGFIGTVLASFAGLFCYWAYRSHKLTLAQEGAMN